MLHRSLPIGLQWTPALSSAGWSHLQQAAQQTGILSSSSRNLARVDAKHIPNRHQQLRTVFQSVDVRQQPKRPRLPYLDPDGPQAYDYWKDMWANRQKPPKPRKPHRLPVYLEPEQQQQILAAAAAAGVPEELIQGNKAYQQKFETPRLIHAINRSGGRIPTQPDKLQQRIQDLIMLQNEVPGLDVQRIFKNRGFSILEHPVSQVKTNLNYISRSLSKAGVSAEAGLLMTAASKPAMMYPVGLIDRAKNLPNVFKDSLKAPMPEKILTDAHKAKVLNKRPQQIQKRLEAMAIKYGEAGAAALYQREPHLLMYRTAILRRKISAIQKALHVDPEQAYKILWGQPKLLTFGKHSLITRIKRLRKLLCVGHSEKDQRGFRWIVQNRPSLLNKNHNTIASKLMTIQQELDISSVAAAAIVRQIPCLGTFSIDSLKIPMQILQNISQRSVLAPWASQARDILRAQPSLLLLIEQSDEPRTSLDARVRLIERVAGISATWNKLVRDWTTAAAANGSQVAHVLTYRNPEKGVVMKRADPVVVERLEWILQQQQQQRQAVEPPVAVEAGLYGLVMMTELDFELSYSGFLAQKRARREARIELARPGHQQQDALFESVKQTVAAQKTRGKEKAAPVDGE